MRKTLFLLTSSFPFGKGEAFLADEFPHLLSAYDKIVVLSNDTESDLHHPLPAGVECHRKGYALTGWEKALSVLGLLSREVRKEMKVVRADYGVPLTRAAVATILVSWFKGRKFARLIRNLAGSDAGAEVHVYSYWANDMALAAAIARRAGWVHRASSRAHGWDVYFERARVRFLPFRRFIAKHLDHLLFVSDHGRRYFERVSGELGHASLGRSRLGTPALSVEALGRVRPFTVISCSSMIPLKRVGLIAEALGLVTVPTRWVHLGDGPARAAVEGICARLPAHVEVELKGHLPHSEVLATLVALRPSVFVSVSETEGLPVSMMEAMSAGIPVIGTRVGGVGEIVEHHRNGVLLTPNPTPAEVAGAVQAFSALSEEEYRGYADRAWATWRDKFNAEENYRAFLDLICRGAGEKE